MSKPVESIFVSDHKYIINMTQCLLSVTVKNSRKRKFEVRSFEECCRITHDLHIRGVYYSVPNDVII